jgi:hypothetical protein
MSQNPEVKNRDSRKADKSNMEEPLNKQGPTEPIEVQGSKKAQATASADVGDAGAAKL